MSSSSLDQTRLSPASTIARMVAVGVDFLIGGCAMAITLMLVARRGWTQIQSMLVDEPEALLVPTFAMALAGLSLPFLFAVSVARHGATPGKALMSLSVRDVATGRLLEYPRALGREALRFANVAPLLLLGEFQIVGVAIAGAVLFDMSRTRLLQTWYDRVLRAVVVAPVAPQQEAD